MDKELIDLLIKIGFLKEETPIKDLYYKDESIVDYDYGQFRYDNNVSDLDSYTFKTTKSKLMKKFLRKEFNNIIRKQKIDKLLNEC